ncbi:MAG TPA: hypothetical protein VGX92_03695 [Pyrinomonadaceae bacterium]|jgi:hypothetical protein|nr:hypothetical protein [Pyrinomonadaceae bacterium]
MKHKWMTVLVVVVTTMTTAQEAFKQYDSFRAQTEGLATLRLWTGFLNAYAPQEEAAAEEEETPAERKAVTCSVNQMPGDASSLHETAAPAVAIEIRKVENRKQDEAGHFARVLVSALEVEHEGLPDEARTEALEHTGEVALLNRVGGSDDETEEKGLRDTETEPVNASDDEGDAHVTRRVLREIRFAGRAADADQIEAASQERDADTQDRGADSPVAPTERSTRAATRAKAKAKRALRVLQLHLDGAARAELRKAARDGMASPPTLAMLPDLLDTASLAGNDPELKLYDSGLIATVSPTEPQGVRATLNATAINEGGGVCASE